MQSSRQRGDYVVEQLTNPPTNHTTTGPNETTTVRTRNEKHSRNVCLQYMDEAGALHQLIPTKSNWFPLHFESFLDKILSRQIQETLLLAIRQVL